MLGLVLLYVGAVLFINGMSMLGHITAREAAIMNVFTGVISFIVCIFNLSTGEPLLIQASAYGLLFSFTYLWVAYNSLTNQDGRGLGWFSFFVSVTAIFITWDSFQAATSFEDNWLVFCWAMWAVLWGLFFALGSLQKTNWTRSIAQFTIVTAVTTAWLPGYLMLSGHMPS